jgi:DNA-binding transcriptional LysR family regulator
MIVHLEALAALAELGTMRSAATRLRVSQSAVSKRIDTLELEVGAVLRQRVGRRVRLTPVAERLLERTRPLLAELRSAIAGERSQAGGWLTLGVSESILASFGPRALAEVRGRRPELQLRIHAHRSPVAIDLVRSGEYMLALVAGEAPAGGDLECLSLGEEEMVLVPSALGKLTLRKGARVPVLSIEPGSATGRALRAPLARLARERGIRIEPESTVQSYTALVQLARAGFGHGLAPLSLALALGVPRKALVRVPAPRLTRPLALIARARMLAREPAASFAHELARTLAQSAIR